MIKILVPIRCFSCGRPIAHLWEDYNRKVKDGKSKKNALDELGLKRYCCRSVFLGNVDLIDMIARFKKN